MTTDLVSLRMLAVGMAGKDFLLLREGVAHASVPIELIEADSVQNAWELLSGMRPIDLVLMDRSLADDDRDMIADIARKATKPAFVVLLTEDRTQDSAPASCADATGRNAHGHGIAAAREHAGRDETDRPRLRNGQVAGWRDEAA